RLADVRMALAGGIDQAMAAAAGAAENAITSEIEILRSRRVIGAAVDAIGFRLQPRDAPFLTEILDGVEVTEEAHADSITLAFTPQGVTAHAAGETARAAYGAPLEI